MQWCDNTEEALFWAMHPLFILKKSKFLKDNVNNEPVLYI